MKETSDEVAGRLPARPVVVRVRLDDQGRAIPPTSRERQERAEAARIALQAMQAIEDDPSEDDAEFFRAIDSHRPDRPLFEGRY